MGEGWTWDETLSAGSAVYYSAGRMPYPPKLAEAIRSELPLDGPVRLLDVGCGPGSLTLVLANLFVEAVGVDADPDMVVRAAERARQLSISNTVWRCMRAEELPADLGRFRVATFAQSFHWMDRSRVASAVREMIEDGGALVLVQATTHRGVAREEPLPQPGPPWNEIDALVRAYLGQVRRAGRGSLPSGPPRNEDGVLRAAGFTWPRHVVVEGGSVVERTEDEVVAAVYSLSSSTPHLFGERLSEFDHELRDLLRATSPSGFFAELTREIALEIWRV